MSQQPATQQDVWLKIEATLCESECRAIAGQYSAAVMHEINNPLEAISNLAYLVGLEAADCEKVRAYAALLETELAEVVRIARQTLSFHKPSDARMPVDLVVVTESALRVHQGKIAAKQIHLVKDLTHEATIEIHPGQMLQVISNLVANAVDALHSHGTLCLRVRKHSREVHLTIADDGHGIPDQILSRVFEPFFTTKRENGTGLGLAISKSIVEGHQGRIRTRSTTRNGRSGTAFRISLPLGKHNSAMATGRGPSN